MLGIGIIRFAEMRKKLDRWSFRTEIVDFHGAEYCLREGGPPTLPTHSAMVARTRDKSLGQVAPDGR
jgi:hypothetical protein